MRWSRTDTVLLSALMLAGVLTRFWHLGIPAQLVFDEHYTVTEARCLLHGLPYADAHPPLASLTIALSIALFGDRAWSWRLPAAILGCALIGITYLLGRRILTSRFGAALAAMFILCDGLFLVDSRIALWEIFYLSFAALAYLMLFRFAEEPDRRSRRRDLAWMGLALGLSMASKLLIPAVALLLVSGFLLFFVFTKPQTDRSSYGQAFAVLGLVCGSSAIVYLAIFLPNYWFGWWHGIADQVNYSLAVFRYQKMYSSVGGHPDASRWWSWPLMLRPIVYWTSGNFFMNPDAKVAAIRAFSNPISCWAVVPAVSLVAIHAVARRSIPHAFLAIGYVLFLAMWIPISRFQFVYYYMPALYLGLFAVADVLVRCCRGEAKMWEQAIILASLSPDILFALGWAAGSITCLLIAIAYAASVRAERGSGVFVCGVFVTAALAGFVYFFPLWTGFPLSPAGFRSRMWLHGSGVANWI